MKEQSYIPRTCTEIRIRQKEKKSLKDYRHIHTYILLGDPGSGKTTEFKREAEDCGGEYIEAANFNDIEKENTNKPLFIDALDEIRASGTRFREMRKKLKEMNNPIRISCRAAEWLEEIDRIDFTVLHLDPLTNKNIKAILKKTDIDQPEKFIHKAHQHHLGEWIRNPQMLALLIKAVTQETTWPESRKAIYETACQKLVSEENSDHHPADKNKKKSNILNAAEYLCAIQLLSGFSGFSLSKSAANAQYTDLSDLASIDQLPIYDALKTNIFRYNGEGKRIPIHRSIAEYLGARYLEKLVANKQNPLPIERVLALMPDDTGIVDSNLRGLYAWLATYCIGDERNKLIIRDPLGVVIYGDVKNFSIREKKLILDTIKRKETYFDRSTVDNPFFGALSTEDMIPVFQSILLSPIKKNSEENLMWAVLSAIRHGIKMPALIDDIEKIIRSSRYGNEIRAYAVTVLIHCRADEHRLSTLISDIQNGSINDRNDGILTSLLGALYPRKIKEEHLRKSFNTYPELVNATAPPQPLLENEKKIKYERISALRHHLTDISEGTALPSIMHDLAEAYHQNSSEDQLNKFLDNDQALIHAAYSGFKKVITRKDLPSHKEIIEFATQDKMYLIRTACLMSIEDNYKDNPKNILGLKDSLLKTFLAFYFTASFEKNEHHDWISSLITTRQELATEVFVEYVSKMIKAEKNHIASFLYFFSHTYSNFFKLFLPSLLERFPLRASQKNSRNILSLLIKEAITNLSSKKIEDIINGKLKKCSIDKIQKTYWLACGLLVHADNYIDELINHLKIKQTYRYDFIIFIQNHLRKNLLFSNMNERTLGLLLELLALECSTLSPDRMTAHLVPSLISELQNRKEGGHELERLMKEKNISQWHPVFELALHKNKIKKIKDFFRYPDISTICQTLQNNEPANAADLSAIALHSLKRITSRLRDSNTDGYKKYWRHGASHQPETPKPENDCRDMLLSDLQKELRPYKVRVDLEASYVDNKRADINISFNDFSIPIEIKRDTNDDLWKSIHHQLIKKYVWNPKAGGYGIYIVFWFGKNGMPPDPQGRGKVHGAKDLEVRLQNDLIDVESQYIQVLVIDCSLPA